MNATEPSESLQQRLAASRKDLLDLTTRNRLLSTPLERARTTALEVFDERSEEIFRILVSNQRSMTFAPAPDAAEQDADGLALPEDEIFRPEEEDTDENGTPERYQDGRLQTGLASEKLQDRLLRTFYDARTYEDEHGVNILFLALGFLKWYESDASDRYHYAPLILVPVALSRSSASTPFRLSYTGDDLAPNLSLEAKLLADFGLKLPAMLDAEDVSIDGYFGEIASAVSGRPRWEVQHNRIALWFFAFSKFLMYRDLDPESWPEGKKLTDNAMLQSLLGGGFKGDRELFGETERLDEALPPENLVHVVDADRWQAVAVEEVRRGRNLVIQGPPGTGKSQTISNLIATAVKDGKKVLFLAEKMAALEVVKRRLDRIQLGDMCLELHSHKARKTSVLEQLRHALALGSPRATDVAGPCERLKQAQRQLNRHADSLHSPLEPSGLTAYQLIGELVKLRARGVTPGRFTLNAPQEWAAEQLRQNLTELEEICGYIRQIGTPSAHPWRGVRAGSILPTDLQRLTVSIEEVRRESAGVIAAAQQLANVLGASPANTLAEMIDQSRFAARLAAAPELDVNAMQDPAWEARRGQISALVAQGAELRRIRQELAEVISEAGWSADVQEARRSIAAHGASIFRWLRGEYRRAVHLLKGIVRGPVPTSREERVALLDRLIAGQKALKAVQQAARLGESAFGRLWLGADCDWAALEAIDAWDRDNGRIAPSKQFRAALAAVPKREDLAAPAARLSETVTAWAARLQGLFGRIELDAAQAFGEPEPARVPIEALLERLEQWLAAGESLNSWTAYWTHHQRLSEAGASEFTALLYTGEIAAETARDVFLLAVYEALMRQAIRRWPHLASFDGQAHGRVIQEFRDLDAGRIRLARLEVAQAHHLGIPRGEGAGEVGVIWREIHKKRRHLPVRQLLSLAGKAVQAIKPVMMMSPMSVAQFLEPGKLDFDLLIVDEASQIRPVEALGAAVRCGQLAVVGDDKQLPPTRFFDKSFESDEADEGELQTADLESILGLCRSQGLQPRMLRWHYRSRHHSLIAVSNREFYDSQLYIPPSPANGDEGLGLKFRPMPDGVFERGGSRCNRPEARAVATAVMEHARQSPEISLGVGTFSLAQRDAILHELERLRREDPSCERFFATGGPEPFFVKNLETIQGDERDVVFISIGYGRDASGYMAMNFGPVSVEGGERRLNVLISRARMRCEVFSSITADDIDLARVSQKGPRVLRTFLSYAQKGVLDEAGPSGRPPDSVFEEEVARALRQIGYECQPQVGVAGFFIDLAVIDPQKPGRYLLGIECDGATYHASHWARERDRLRQQVLEDRGWKIHRIWSTDWFYRPEEQLRKLAAAIEQARARAAPEGVAPDHDSSPAHTVEAEPSITRSAKPERTRPVARAYREAAFRVPSQTPLLEMSDAALADTIVRIVEVEGPIHEDEVARRVTGLWNLGRVGKRIAGKVDTAIRMAETKGKVRLEEGFCSVPGQEDAPPRNREAVHSASLRQPERLPPAEIRGAIRMLLEAYVAMSREEACREVCRLLGFKALGESLREVIAEQIDALLARQAIRETEGGICLA